MRQADHIHDLRERIIAAAERVFDANGYAATTMEAVAAEADVGKGSIYNYFRNKQDLFAQACLQTLEVGRSDLERLASRPMPASAKIEEFVDDWFEHLGGYKRFGRLVLEFWAAAAREKRRGELTDAIERIAREGERTIQGIIEQGVASGEFARGVNAAAAASLIVAVLRGITVQAIVVGSEIGQEFTVEMKRGLLASFAARADRTDVD